ncbi:hypothetical protein F4802DRAFT_598983 [Xylaria palmicola]|nr:hypothetical protein F4802DRAFT_598983 [Xylaria palmicola]
MPQNGEGRSWLAGPRRVAQSLRFNRHLVLPGPVSEDDRVGGGVSLTAKSDVEDGARVHTLPPPPLRNQSSSDNINNGRRPATPLTPPSSLRGDAKPFEPSFGAYAPALPKTPPSYIEPVDVKVSNPELIDGEPGHVVTGEGKEQDAASILLRLYQGEQRRVPSEETLVNGGRASNGHRSYADSTAFSSPAKTVRDEVSPLEIGTLKQASKMHDQNGWVNHQVASPVQDGIRTLSEADNQSAEGSSSSISNFTNSIEDYQNCGTYRDGLASSHTYPTLPHDVEFVNCKPGANGQRRHHSLDTTGCQDDMAVKLTQSIASVANGAANQRSQPQDSSQVSMSPTNNYAVQAYNQKSPTQGPPGVYAAPAYHYNYPNHDLSCGGNPVQAIGNSMPHTDQTWEVGPSTAGYSTSAPQHVSRGSFSSAGSYPGSYTQNSLPVTPGGYRSGLTGSASDGTMSRYLGNEGADNSMAVAKVGSTPTQHHQLSIGPMDFGTATREVMKQRSEMLQALTENGRPHLHDILNHRNLPFVESHKLSCPSREVAGVVLIKNIPYETTRGEIIALLGKSSKILNDREEPVHIIMDRVTAKTQDAYCELASFDAASELVERFRRGAEHGRGAGRLGNRVVEVELSSQSHLMRTLFPSTLHGVHWQGNRPKVVAQSRYPWENFRAFFTVEEMAMLTKHVESPQRAPFVRNCPERPYECMISTLRKIPWYMAEHITIKERHAVYEATERIIRALVSKISSQKEKAKSRTAKEEEGGEGERLTPQLLRRLVTSAMLCPGFSVVQKHNIACVAGISPEEAKTFNQPRFPDSWRHQWTLMPKPNIPYDVLEWYISIIRTQTNREVQSLGISQSIPLQSTMENLDGYWGFFWAEANFPVGAEWDNMSLAACSRLEWQAIERILTRAIQGGSIPDSYTSGSYHVDMMGTSPF